MIIRNSSSIQTFPITWILIPIKKMQQATLQCFIVLFFTLLSIPRFQRPVQGLKLGNESDYEALLAIKAKISDDPDAILSSWGNTSLHFCQWRGVICGRRHSRVVVLHLSSSKLVGTLSPSIGNLSFLNILALANNSFRGDIPHQISSLPRLQILILTMNSFEGEFPANLSHCSQLRRIDLRNNKLVGRIPPEVALLRNLIQLALSFNSFSGTLEAIGIGNMSTSLQTLQIDNNRLQGSIPDDIGRLQSLTGLSLGDNRISGIIPTSFFNLSSIDMIYLTNTEIYGYLPRNVSLHFPLLSGVGIANTSLTGQFPDFSNLPMLGVLDLSLNSFSGRFSFNGNNMPNLKHLDIDHAFAMGGELRSLKFLDTLTNCTSLLSIWLAGGSFTGLLPPSILNLSTTLQIINLPYNYVSGQLPSGLSKFVNLSRFVVYGNHFTGPIPADIVTLKSMALLDFSYNNFSEEIPSSLGNLTLLTELHLKYNNLEGSLPKSLGNCLYLQAMDFTDNKLSGIMPVEIFDPSNLIFVLIGRNNLQGSLPAEISRLKNLQELDVSENRLSGEIPSSLGGCTDLLLLNLSANSFVGSIPKTLSPLQSINALDLSYNNLSGQIPSYFSNWSHLSSLNLSFNNFEGEVPLGGVFNNTSVVSVVGNSKLCGGVPQLHLPSCPQQRESKRRRLSLRVVVIISVTSVLTVVLAAALCIYLVCSSKTKKATSFGSQKKPFLEVSYQMLSSATDGFSPSNLIGVGGFGSVYKGILRQDESEIVVAVKVLNLQNKGAGKSFIAECNALRDIRHRNLCKVITVCSSIDAQRNDFKALVYEFMPRGSLEGWLHSSSIVTNDEQVGDNLSSGLSVFQRISIAIDVASALEYLHVGCASPIIHCDLKPNNILLDDEMTAHVGDFGLAKFLPEASTSNSTNQTSSTQVRGTVGYAAPEYGLGSKVSPEGDVYSFGIIVLEMMTSKKPTDPMFNDNLNLHGYSKSALPDQFMEIIDQRMLGDDTNVLHPRSAGDMRKIECIKSLIMAGVHCSMAQPQERMSISNALNELKSARQKILSGGPRN